MSDLEHAFIGLGTLAAAVVVVAGLGSMLAKILDERGEKQKQEEESVADTPYRTPAERVETPVAFDPEKESKEYMRGEKVLFALKLIAQMSTGMHVSATDGIVMRDIARNVLDEVGVKWKK